MNTSFRIAALAALLSAPVFAATTPQEQAAAAKRPGIDGTYLVTVGKTLSIQSPLPIERVSIAADTLAQAVPISATEILINGMMPGETSLIVWQKGGSRLVYDLIVRVSPAKLDAVRQQIAHDYPADDINVTFDNDTAFVRGTVNKVSDAEHVMLIAQTLGHAVNLLQVKVPEQPAQILLKVRFADVDRSASQQLGFNIASSAFNQTTGITTGSSGSAGISGDGTNTFSLSTALNVLLFRKDLNLGVTIQALQSKNLLQTLAEPNIMGTSGVRSSFHAGGEIPVPLVQGSSALGTVTISYRPYGIQLSFLPEVTPRGTIKLQVTPEVSSLDYANSVTLGGTTVPGFTTRRLETEVELESGQSFVVAGLLDNSTTESLSKIPGLANIPILGKLFQSRSIQKNNSELLVIVTPEIVRPIPGGQATPMTVFSTPFLPGDGVPMRQPGMDKTGEVQVHPPQPTVPADQLMLQQKAGAAPQLPAAPAAGAPGGASAVPTPPTGTGK
jgi:pilus assembly protein CpaC